MAIPRKSAPWFLLAAAALFWSAAVSADLSRSEEELLRQTGPVNLDDHPDPKALKKTWFWVDATPTPERPVEPALPSPARGDEDKPLRKTNEDRLESSAALLAGWLNEGRFDKALDQSKKLYEERPDVALRLSQHFWEDWLRPLLFEGDDEHAEPFLELMLTLDPKDAQAHEALGTVYWRRGKDSQAREHYRRALQLDPQKAYLEKRLRRLRR